MNHNFENLEVWKRGCRLAINVCVASHKSREFALRDQIHRSAISIPSNIAEGSERSSEADFSRFLSYSKGSCGELRTQLMIHREVQGTENRTFQQYRHDDRGNTGNFPDAERTHRPFEASHTAASGFLILVS
ncbi:MAG: four helix bundle protein [Akkermansiaceae bacterium]|nr:four helix bundle protein [Akkermansiaceae bacterium]